MSRAAVFFAAIFCAATANAETAYFTAIPDLPIAPGLAEAHGRFPTSISGPHQDLVLASARGAVSPASVERFYDETLAALGWSYMPGPREAGMMFARGRELLTLHISPDGQGARLSVRLVVRNASMNAD